MDISWQQRIAIDLPRQKLSVQLIPRANDLIIRLIYNLRPFDMAERWLTDNYPRHQCSRSSRSAQVRKINIFCVKVRQSVLGGSSAAISRWIDDIEWAPIPRPSDYKHFPSVTFLPPSWLRYVVAQMTTQATCCYYRKRWVWVCLHEADARILLDWISFHFVSTSIREVTRPFWPLKAFPAFQFNQGSSCTDISGLFPKYYASCCYYCSYGTPDSDESFSLSRLLLQLVKTHVQIMWVAQVSDELTAAASQMRSPSIGASFSGNRMSIGIVSPVSDRCV